MFLFTWQFLIQIHKASYINTSIDLDRCNSPNQLFIQVETNQQQSQELIQNVFVELNYVGDNIHTYNKTFQLYDNAINGDLIPANGIYTLLAHADTVLMPDIDPKLINIDISWLLLLGISPGSAGTLN